MSWFATSLICVLGWGLADLFYKRASEGEDRYSHLKIAVWVGLVMGVCALALLPFAESAFTPGELLSEAVRYAPASLCYIASMVIGYAGMRYLELSIVSPVQNASGAFSLLFMLAYFTMTGRIGNISEAFSTLDLCGAAFIVAGMIALAVLEERASRAEATLEEKHRYTHGALALIFPLLYCLFDTLGTTADGILLDDGPVAGLGEIDVLVLYGLTFLLFGLCAWIFLRVRTGRWYNPFAASERPKALAAVCEEFGQVFYVFAMAARPMLAAPMVASYCIVSVLLSRLFLKEKLRPGQYACIFAVIAGIVMLGISEGIASA